MKIIWAAGTLSVTIFLLQSQQKGFSLQSLPQLIHKERLFYPKILCLMN